LGRLRRDSPEFGDREAWFVKVTERHARAKLLHPVISAILA